MEEKDMINPSHYKIGNAQVIDITEHLSFNLGNAVKYCARSGRKDPNKTLEDLQKAQWYIDREIKRLGLYELENKKLELMVAAESYSDFKMRNAEQDNDIDKDYDLLSIVSDCCPGIKPQNILTDDIGSFTLASCDTTAVLFKLNLPIEDISENLIAKIDTIVKSTYPGNDDNDLVDISHTENLVTAVYDESLIKDVRERIKLSSDKDLECWMLDLLELVYYKLTKVDENLTDDDFYRGIKALEIFPGLEHEKMKICLDDCCYFICLGNKEKSDSIIPLTNNIYLARL